MNKIIFVTGATSGFGKAIAEKFAAAQYDIIISGRRNDRLLDLQKALEEKYKVRVLPISLDVTQKEKVFDCVNNLPAEWKNIDVLVNNAGLAAGRDLFDEASLDDWEKMIDTNVKGLLYVSRAVLPLMISRKKGHVIHIGSTAGKEVYERGNIYCATKHAVEAIAKAMRIDLLQHHIKVTAVHPGAAETEFSKVRFKGDEALAKKVYEGYQPLSAEDVADIVYYTTTLPAHVCINDLIVTSTAQANSYYLYKES